MHDLTRMLRIVLVVAVPKSLHLCHTHMLAAVRHGQPCGAAQRAYLLCPHSRFAISYQEVGDKIYKRKVGSIHPYTKLYRVPYTALSRPAHTHLGSYLPVSITL
eukprot:SAG25_NODE_1296_length_3362_cov_1.978547_3_plen_104_part_00